MTLCTFIDIDFSKGLDRVDRFFMTCLLSELVEKHNYLFKVIIEMMFPGKMKKMKRKKTMKKN